MTTRPTDEEMDRCERMLTDCACHPDYQRLGMTDPGCMACHLGSEVIDTFKDMRAALQSIAQPLTSVSDALNFLEEWALAGNQLHGDDIPQFHATVERIAPVAKTVRVPDACTVPSTAKTMTVCTCGKSWEAGNAPDCACRRTSPQPQQAVNAPFGNADHIPPVEGVQFLHINNLSSLKVVPDGFQWMDGIPVHPWDKEWFIAELDNGDRVVLKALPDEYTYDFKTADETYLAKRRIKRWMQFPDSDFIAAPAYNGKKEG